MHQNISNNICLLIPLVKISIVFTKCTQVGRSDRMRFGTKILIGEHEHHFIFKGPMQLNYNRVFRRESYPVTSANIV